MTFCIQVDAGFERAVQIELLEIIRRRAFNEQSIGIVFAGFQQVLPLICICHVFLCYHVENEYIIRHDYDERIEVWYPGDDLLELNPPFGALLLLLQRSQNIDNTQHGDFDCSNYCTEKDDAS